MRKQILDTIIMDQYLSFYVGRPLTFSEQKRIIEVGKWEALE
jgi:hypothetical protein